MIVKDPLNNVLGGIMYLKVGENIKRLRHQHNITQEKLAAALNVSSAAVSKWESGDTYPDITMLFPLAYFFKISVDDLLGYDEMVVEEEIKQIIKKYNSLRWDLKYDEASELIVKARNKYPQDYRIMHSYIFDLVGGLADNDDEVLRKHETEITKITDMILEGCKEERLRLDAVTLKAKLLYALGEKYEAINLLNTLPSFYHSSGQRLEQLYSKSSKEYLKQLNLNMYELAEFVGGKIARTIIFDMNLNQDEKIARLKNLMEKLSGFSEDDLAFILIRKCIFAEASTKGYRMGWNEDFIIDSYLQSLKLSKELDEIAKRNPLLREYNIATYGYEERYPVTYKFIPEKIKNNEKFNKQLKV